MTISHNASVKCVYEVNMDSYSIQYVHGISEYTNRWM